MDRFEIELRAITAKEYWSRLERIGWLELIPKDQRQEFIRAISDSFVDDPFHTEVWTALTMIGFDSESMHDEPYSELLIDIAKYIGEELQPTEIIEEWRDAEVEMSFVNNDQQHRFVLSNFCDYLDEKFFESINYILEEIKVLKRVFLLPNNDQMYMLVIVPPELYHRAEIFKLIPPREYFYYRENYSEKKVNKYLEKYYNCQKTLIKRE